MSLINCPECTHKISNQVITCPECGYPLKRFTPPSKRSFWRLSNLIMPLIIITFIVGAVVSVFNPNNNGSNPPHKTTRKSPNESKALSATLAVLKHVDIQISFKPKKQEPQPTETEEIEKPAKEKKTIRSRLKKWL